jgi:hypothetical protein
MLKLCRHRPGVSILDAVQTQHHSHVGLQRLPEFLLKLLWGRHALISCGEKLFVF